MVQKNLSIGVHTHALAPNTQLGIFENPGNYIAEIPDELLEAEYIKRNCILPGDHFGSSSNVAKFLKTQLLKEKDREHMSVLFLNAQNQLIATERMFSGSLSTSAVYPREIIKKVLEYSAGSIILVHNHPSGTIAPSSSDRAVTKKVQSALSSIDVELLDHVIIGYGNSDFFSFADHRLL